MCTFYVVRIVANSLNQYILYVGSHIVIKLATIFKYRIIIIAFHHTGVRNLMNTTYSPNTIIVSWDAAESPYCGGVLYYIVVISSDEYSNIIYLTVNVTVSTATYTHTFSNLRNDTNHNITVTAVNRAGAGMTTELTNVRTLSPVPPQSNDTKQ